MIPNCAKRHIQDTSILYETNQMLFLIVTFYSKPADRHMSKVRYKASEQVAKM